MPRPGFPSANSQFCQPISIRHLIPRRRLSIPLSTLPVETPTAKVAVRESNAVPATPDRDHHGAAPVRFRRKDGRTPTSWPAESISPSPSATPATTAVPTAVPAALPRRTRLLIRRPTAAETPTRRPSGFVVRETPRPATLQPGTRKRRARQRPIRRRRDTERVRRLGPSTSFVSTARHGQTVLGPRDLVSARSTTPVSPEHHHPRRR